MSDAQWRVLSILLLAAGIEAVFSPLAGNFFKSVVNGKTLTTGALDPNNPLNQQLSAGATAAIAFTLSAVLLLWLADSIPNLATAIASIILLLVVLRYAGDIGSFLGTATTYTPTQGGAK